MTDTPKPFARRIVDHMLDAETERQISEQQTALAKNPEWADGYYHLAQLYRVYRYRQDEAKALLLTALQKKPTLAEAHLALGEIYIMEDDLESAREHAQFAADLGHPRLLEQMRRHGVLPPGGLQNS